MVRNNRRDSNKTNPIRLFGKRVIAFCSSRGGSTFWIRAVPVFGVYDVFENRCCFRLVRVISARKSRPNNYNIYEPITKSPAERYAAYTRRTGAGAKTPRNPVAILPNGFYSSLFYATTKRERRTRHLRPKRLQ